VNRWLFPITGRPEDLTVLRESLRTGPRRLEEFDDEHGRDICLCDEGLELTTSGVQALDAVRPSFNLLNEIVSFRRGPTYQPVVLTGTVYEGCLMAAVAPGRTPFAALEVGVVGRSC
jgi:hypothetical protein